MSENFFGYQLLDDLTSKNEEFAKKINKGLENGLLRKFDEREWNLIKEQNFISFIPNVNSFYDIFKLGYNIGDCVGVSRQLSYSYDGVDIVSGRLPILIGTRNAEIEGGHCWLENENYIIDTSLLLIIDKSYGKEVGYIEEQRISSHQLGRSSLYGSRKEFVRDSSIKSGKNRV